MNTTTPNTTSAPEADLERLRHVISDMDCYAQSAFASIVAIARMVLLGMEAPEGYRRFDAMGDALNALVEIAEGAADAVGNEAERLGCGYTDRARVRRLAAHIKALELGYLT